MSRLIECLVTEPPTGGEVLAQALGKIAQGHFDLVLLPTEQEVPRPENLPLVLHLRNLNFPAVQPDEGSWKAIITSESENEDITSVIIRIPNDTEAPAEATLVAS